MLWKTALAWKIRATKRWRTIIAKMMMLRISLLALINVRMPNSLLFYIICSSGLRLACKFFCVYLPIWMRSDLKRLVLCAYVICLFWFFKILFLKDYGLAIYIFACSLQINTFNSLKKKKKKPTFSFGFWWNLPQFFCYTWVWFVRLMILVKSIYWYIWFIIIYGRIFIYLFFFLFLFCV